MNSLRTSLAILIGIGIGWFIGVDQVCMNLIDYDVPVESLSELAGKFIDWIKG